MNLDILDAFDSDMEWVRVQAQRLLQHVESRRSKSLTNFKTESMPSKFCGEDGCFGFLQPVCPETRRSTLHQHGIQA